MATTRIYVVRDTANESKRLVRASTQAQAIRHVVKDRFEVTVADQETLVFMMSGGAKVEDAAVEPVEPASVTGQVTA